MSLAKSLRSLLVALSIVSVPACAEDQQRFDRILFVGNSFSYFNNGLHNHYSNFMRAAGEHQVGKTRARLKTISGGRFYEQTQGLWHLLDANNTRYDAVVLQGYSSGATDERHIPRFESGLRELAIELHERDIQPIFFATWAYKDNPEMTSQIEAAYQGIADETDAIVVRVGAAFALAMERHPEIELYSPDINSFDAEGNPVYKPVLKHPSVAGTYLSAATFFATLRGSSPEGSVYDAGLDAETAAKLQAIAAEIAGL